jgi:hypothetical protein
MKDYEYVLQQLNASVAAAAAAKAAFQSEYPEGGDENIPVQKVVYINAGGDLQAALDAEPVNTKFVCEPFDYGNIRPPDKPGWGQSEITSSLDTPFGWNKLRAFPMPRMQMVHFAPRSHDWKITGFRSDTPDHLNEGRWNVGTSQETTPDDLPRNITFDRCYLRADPAKGGHRGIAANGRNVKFLNGVIEGFWQEKRDSQAIGAWWSPGPWTIHNSYLEATGENVIFGGQGGTTPDAFVPRGLMMTRCHLRKHPSWKPVWFVTDPNAPNLPGSSYNYDYGTLENITWVSGKHYASKNLFELKAMLGWTVEDCILENCWPDAQDGDGVLLTAREALLSDGYFRRNILLNVQGFAFRTLSQNDGGNPGTVGKSRNLQIEDNLFWNVDSGMLINKGWDQLAVRRNTWNRLHGNSILNFSGQANDTVDMVEGLEYVDNIQDCGEYYITGPGLGTGFPAFNAFVKPGYVMKGNTFGRHIQPGRSTDQFPDNTYIDGCVADLLNADGSVKSGKGGANIAALKAANAWFKWY